MAPSVAMHMPSGVSLHRPSLRRGHLGLIVGAIVALAIAALLIALPDRADQPPPVDAFGKLSLEREPYIGVACRVPNAIACDRVGLTVWLREPAVRVDATVAGEQVRLRRAHWRDGDGKIFDGYVQRRRFIDGTLGVRPDRPNGRWWGTGRPRVRVHLRAVSPEGTRLLRNLRVPLAAGYG